MVFFSPLFRWLFLLFAIAFWSRWNQARKAKAEKLAADIALRWFEKSVDELTPDELVYHRKAMAEQQING